MSDPKLTRRQLVEQLQSGERHVFDDADELNGTEAFSGEAIHRCRNGSVVVNFTYDGAYENTIAGGVYDLDLMGDDQ
jgi:hypothetical protein